MKKPFSTQKVNKFQKRVNNYYAKTNAQSEKPPTLADVKTDETQQVERPAKRSLTGEQLMAICYMECIAHGLDDDESLTFLMLMEQFFITKSYSNEYKNSVD